MTFLALLLKLGMFRKIKLNFDLVGHTHEDVDQMFEALSQRLHRKTIGTVEKLMDLLKDGYKNNNMNVPFYAERLNAVGGYKKWIMPFERGMHNHTLPHCFKESPQIASYTVLLHFVMVQTCLFCSAVGPCVGVQDHIDMKEFTCSSLAISDITHILFCQCTLVWPCQWLT